MAELESGSELFNSYENELKLVLADLDQKRQRIAELSGEERQAAVKQADASMEEATDLLNQMRIEKQNIPSASRQSANKRFRDFETDLDTARRALKGLSSSRAALFGSRYRDNPGDDDGGPVDEAVAQRQQLLSGTDRLERSSQRLRDSQRVAHETEAVGQQTLADLHVQREQIRNTRDRLLESEGYVDRSVKTLRGMARRMATNRIITAAIIAVLILLIFAVIYSKFH